ncbi:MAG: hypothetical protein HC845_06025 [Akkermansiaceae bacterium]|nr:hypothetical protein [Akkermansiaceae bacterium]
MIREISKFVFYPVRRLAKSPALQRKATSLFQKLASAPRGKKLLHFSFKRFRWYYLMQARIQRQQGDDRGAFHSLMMGQRCPGDDEQLHIKLSELYRDNDDVLAAHHHLKFADALNPGYSTIRLLTFESDHGMLAEGTATMSRVLDLPSEQIEPYVAMINRIAIFYPEHQKKLNTHRKKLKTKLQASSYSKPTELSQATITALACRWLSVATYISKDKTAKLPSSTQKLLSRLNEDLGSHQQLLELAWQNESSDELAAILKSKSIAIKDLPKNTHQIVELFIPTPFLLFQERKSQLTKRCARFFAGDRLFDPSR